MIMKIFLLFLVVYIFSVFKIYCQNNIIVDSLKIQQLAGLCKVWGYLKYYHPEIQKGNIDWDTTLILHIPKILKANNNEEYNKIINQIILLPGKVKKLNKPYKYLPKDTSYNNFDYAWLNNKKLFTGNNSKLLFEVIENYKPRNNVYLKRELNKYYGGDKNFDKYYYPNEYYPDTAHALLALYRYWNVINYFFAYKKITDENWNDVLIEFIPKILESAGSVKFYLTLAELTTKINDCHSYYENYNFNHELGVYKPSLSYTPEPIEVEFIDNKTIITAISDSLSAETNFKTGDIILKINGIDVNERRKELAKYCGCSHQLSVEREINTALLRYPLNKEISITITILDSNNALKTAVYTIKRTYQYWDSHYEEAKWQKFSDSIGYVNLWLMSMKEIRKAFKDLRNTNALIFDLRNNASAPLFGIALRLTGLNQNNVVFAKYFQGNFKYPGTFKPSYERNIYLGLKIFYKKYTGKVIFLINENVQSTYEWSLMGLKASYDVTLIGNNTAGADGAASSFLIQNNFLTYFTVGAVFYPDESPTQRVGIKPDIYAMPTIKGIREHRDEVLERSIEFIKTGK